MDYELKYVIAICLIVKIGALSPEIPIGEETENPEQGSSRVEAPPFPPAEPRAASTGRTFRGSIFDRGPGEEKLDANDVIKVNENQSFDTCVHKLELLESSLNWRNIRKTLHWLDRILASNETELCHRRKSPLKRFHPGFDSPISKLNLKKKNWRKSTWSRRSSNHRNKKFKKDRKHKHKSWKTRLRGGKKIKSSRKNFLNATILKPNSVLHNVEKMFFQRTKNTKFWNHVVKNCEGLKCTEKEKTEATGQDHANETKMVKQKPWPHFVYHRVSSNFLHPDSPNHNHKQSAYIAISVVTSSKADTTENTENV